MRKLKSYLGIVAFALLSVVGVSTLYISSVSSQEKQNTKEDVSISWSPVKREIKSVNSKFTINLPDSIKGQNWVIGVIPVKEGEKETIVAGTASWKDGPMGRMMILDKVVDVSDESIKVINGQADLVSATEFNSDTGKSLVILLNVKPRTNVSVLQKGEEIASKAFTSESGIIAKSEAGAMEGIGIKKVTGVSSLLGELQTRKLLERFRNPNQGENN